MPQYTKLAALGDWTFYQVTGYGDDVLYGYAHGLAYGELDKPKVGELYDSLDHAMASAIAEKYTGPRGAGGTGVGTAADWFMRSIGAFDPTREELITRAAKSDTVLSAATHGLCSPEVAAANVIDTLELGRK